MDISVVIPAKGLSKRVANKNLYQINNRSLIRRACEKVLLSSTITNCYLDTEDDFIIRECSDLIPKGLRIIKRPPELATNYIGANELMVWALHSIPPCDLLLQTFATSPLLTIQTIDSCISTFLESELSYDSFFTVIPVQEYFWEGNRPANFNPKILPNSFELGKQYMETHGLYGIYTDTLLKTKTRVGKKPLLIPVTKIESLDIDTEDDLKIAEALICMAE